MSDILVSHAPSLFLHTSITTLGTFLSLIVSLLPMVQGENDLHLKFLTNFEENEHEAFWQCRLQVNQYLMK